MSRKPGELSDVEESEGGRSVDFNVTQEDGSEVRFRVPRRPLVDRSNKSDN